MSELIEFFCPVHRAGYELREGLPGDGKRASELLLGAELPPGLHIVPKGHKTDLVDPMNIGGVFRNFVDWEATPEGAIEFTNAFGFLLADDFIKDRPSSLVSDWLHRQEGLRSAVLKWEAGDVTGLVDTFNSRKFGELTTKLRPNRTGTSVSLVLKPRSLWSFMFLEFALHVSNKSGLKQCKWCGQWFPYGTGTGKRSKAKFCSDPCRKSSHAHSKKGEKL